MSAAMHIPPQCRIVIDNDWAGDPDGLVALAHHLLSSANEVLAITGTANSPLFGPPEGTAERGAELACSLVAQLGRADVVTAGPDTGFDGTLRPNPAADALVEALTAKHPAPELPLYLVCGGPLTTVADALLRAPQLADRVTLVWVGGTAGPVGENGEPEYNESTDQAAADFVFGHTGFRILQFPAETYRPLTVSVVELEDTLLQAGPVGAWLWSLFVDLPLPDFIRRSPMWCLGDSAPIVVTALDDVTSPLAGAGPHRHYTAVDTRMILGDLGARLRAFARASVAGTE